MFHKFKYANDNDIRCRSVFIEQKG